MLVGSVLSCIILREMMVVGIRVTPQVFITRKVIMLLVASSLFLFNFCREFMAFNPNGVAAFPSPNILAIIFEEIKPSDSWPLGISGNSFISKGVRKSEAFFNNPESLAMFIIPSQVAIKGNICMIRSKVVLPLDSIVLFKISALPFIMRKEDPVIIKNIHSLFIIYF